MSDLPDIYGEKGKNMTRDEYNKLKEIYTKGSSHMAFEKKGEKQMNRVVELVIDGLHKEIRDSVSWAYDFGFRTGCISIKRYAVNVMFHDSVYKDSFKMFSTLEEAKGYIKGAATNNECVTYLYEYNDINEQYESLEI